MKKILLLPFIIPLFLYSQDPIFVSNELTYGHAEYNDVIYKVLSDEDHYITFGCAFDDEYEDHLNWKVFNNDTLITNRRFRYQNWSNHKIHDAIIVENDLYVIASGNNDEINLRQGAVIRWSDFINEGQLEYNEVSFSSDSISSILLHSNGNIYVSGSKMIDNVIHWQIQSFDQELNNINDITFRRETPTMHMIASSSVKLLELSNGNLAHFGVALNSTDDDRHSYFSTIDHNLESVFQTKWLEWSDTYTEYVINDAIIANISGEDRFFTTGYNIDDITSNGNTSSTRMLTISSYDIDGNSIFSTDKNIGDMENGKGIILTGANTLLIVGKTKQIVGVYSNINYPLYGNEYGGDNYNFLIHECDPSNDGATISNTVYGSYRHEGLNDIAILDNKEIILVGYQQSENGVDLANNPDLYLDQHIAKLNISDCTNELASNYSNMMANYDDGSCLYSESIYQNQESTINNLEDNIAQYEILLQNTVPTMAYNACLEELNNLNLAYDELVALNVELEGALQQQMNNVEQALSDLDTLQFDFDLQYGHLQVAQNSLNEAENYFNSLVELGVETTNDVLNLQAQITEFQMQLDSANFNISELNTSLTLSSNEILDLEGQLASALENVVQPIYIDLPSGWSMFGYTKQDSNDDDLVELTSCITEKIIIVKDHWGASYLPEWNFNGVGDLTPGQGYQIKLTEFINDFNFCD